MSPLGGTFINLVSLPLSQVSALSDPFYGVSEQEAALPNYDNYNNRDDEEEGALPFYNNQDDDEDPEEAAVATRIPMEDVSVNLNTAHFATPNVARRVSTITDSTAHFATSNVARTVSTETESTQDLPPCLSDSHSHFSRYNLRQKRKIVELSYPPEGPSKVRCMARRFGVVHGTIVNWKKCFDERQATPPWHPYPADIDMEDLYSRAGMSQLRSGVNKYSFHLPPRT